MSAIRNFKVRESTDYIVIHSTGSSDDIGAADIRRQHLARGWLDLAYHFVVRRNGVIETGRVSYAPAGFDPKQSVAICLVGSEEITPEQAASLRSLVTQLIDEYPEASVYNKCQFTNFQIGEITNEPDHRNDSSPRVPPTGSPSSEPLA